MKSFMLRFGAKITNYRFQHKTFRGPLCQYESHQLLLSQSRLSFTSYSSSFCNVTNQEVPHGQYKLSYAQPTQVTHPEFFKNPGHVIPGISKEEFKNRRTRLGAMALRFAQRTRSENTAHLLVIPAASKKYMTENIPFPFRQNSNFLYLTGSYEPDAVLVLAVKANGDQSHAVFLDDPDDISDLWEGKRTSPDAAVQHLGLDRASLISLLDSHVKDFAKSSNQFVLWCEDRSVLERFRLQSSSQPVHSPKALLHALRVIKSSGEIELMKTSARIASEAFRSTIRFCSETVRSKNVLSEHHIWAKLDYECRLRGAERLAYPPVIASGSRANIIHYVHNKNLCHPNDLCLVDAGCEFFGYCSDITRTFPVDGEFTAHQRTLYELVLDVQQKLIRLVEPGMTLDRLFLTMGSFMLEGLQDLGIIHQTIDISQKSTDLALRFCPHHVSHYLGMDVHDTSAIERHSALQPGMIVTVEPGIYLQGTPGSYQDEMLTKVGREFVGMGIRIEDDVLVTPDGQEVLTTSCPKTVTEIEQSRRL